jgi:hypothetical protein
LWWKMLRGWYDLLKLLLLNQLYVRLQLYHSLILQLREIIKIVLSLNCGQKKLQYATWPLLQAPIMATKNCIWKTCRSKQLHVLMGNKALTTLQTLPWADSSIRGDH